MIIPPSGRVCLSGLDSGITGLLNPEKLTRDDLWHLEDTKWRQVDAHVIGLDLIWDENTGGSWWICMLAYGDLQEGEGDHEISALYWFNTPEYIRELAGTAPFLLVEKSL